MHLRYGLTRIVIITRRYAIKLPRPAFYGIYADGLEGLLWTLCRGILANQSEASWWADADEDTRTKLCPLLLSYWGIINVYPRCEPYIVDEQTELDMFHRKSLPLDLMPDPGDSKPDNYGWLDGRLVRIDYDMSFNGCPHDLSGAFNRLEQDRRDAALVE